MIENKNTKPTYVPRGQRALDAEIASKQIAKAASAEVVALSAADTANFVLRKATENLEAAKVAYFAALEKSAWNLGSLKDSYNNALAGFRDAEKASQATSEELVKAKALLAGLRKKAKKDEDDDSSDDDYSDDDSSEYDEFEKALVTQSRATAVTAKEEAAADSMAGDDPKAAADALGTLADTHERLSGMARQTGNLQAHSAHAAEAGRLRAKSILVRAKANNKETLKSAADFVGKRAFSDEKRQELAAKGHARPDGSFPIETKGDIANAIQSVGRAKDYDAAKAHIIDRAKDLDAVDALPDDWKVNKAAAMLILCPSCMGMGCSGCDNGTISPSDLDNHFGDVSDDSQETVAMSAFSTNSLLTRDFQKSAAYKEYLLAKGDVPGHEFHGNQYEAGGGGSSVREAKAKTEAAKNDPTYATGHAAHTAASDAWTKVAAEHTAKGEYAQANAAEKIAQQHRMAAEVTASGDAYEPPVAASDFDKLTAKYDAVAGKGATGAETSAARTVPIPGKQVPQVRDPNWNPRTSGPLVNMPMVGMQRGFNDIIRDYKASFDTHLKNSDQATADAKAAVAKGDLETATRKAQEAVDELNNAVKAGRGVYFTHEKYQGKIAQANAAEDSEAMKYRKQARDIVDNKIPPAEEFAAQIDAAYKQSEAGKDAATKIVGL